MEVQEEKITEYGGYKIYRVPDADPEDFEVWKNGRKVMAFDTEAAAKEWIDDTNSMAESIRLKTQARQSIKRLMSGARVRAGLTEAADNDLADLRIAMIEALGSLVSAWDQVLTCYENLEDVDPDFPDAFTEEYPFNKSFDELLLDVMNWRDHIRDGFR